MIKNFNTINLHGRCEISQLAFTHTHPNHIASLSHDYFIKITDIDHYKTLRQLNLVRSYLTALSTHSKSITVGTGEGELITLDPNSLEIISKQVIHSDCITGIIEEDNHIVTISYDGLVKFTDKRNFKQIRSIDVSTPITQLQKFGSKYYLAGVRSFEVDADSVREFAQYNRFLNHAGKLYGTNDQNGFTCITEKEKRYVPCQNMVGYGKGVLGTSWQTISYFATNKEDSISCLSVKADQFRQGDTINSLVSKQSRVFAGAQSGNLYVFELDMSHSWLEQ